MSEKDEHIEDAQEIKDPPTEQPETHQPEPPAEEPKAEPKKNPFDAADEQGAFNPDDLLNELGAEKKQGYGFEDEFQAHEPELEEPEDKTDKNGKTEDPLSARERKLQANLMSDTYNTIQAFLNSLGTGNEFTKYKFSNDVTQDIANHMDAYMKESGTVKLPSWLGLAVAVTIATLPKFMEGQKDRKARKHREKAAAQKARQQKGSSVTPVEIIPTSSYRPVQDVEPESITDEHGRAIDGKCEWCGNALSPTQKRFCSRGCLNDWNKTKKKK